MVTQFEPIFPSANEDMITAFERKNNWSLPVDYRRFLLSHNGGSPSPPSVCVLKSIKERVLVDMLFGLGHQERDLDIETWMSDFGTELPPGYLIIGNVGGLLFVLCVQGQETGVLCWDRMGELLKSPDSSSGHMYPVASSFSEFLHSLTPME